MRAGVEVDEVPPKIPAACVCCMGRADGHVGVECDHPGSDDEGAVPQTVSLEFPVCGFCRKHGWMDSLMSWMLMGAAILGFVLPALIVRGLKGDAAAPFSAHVGVFLIGFAVMAAFRRYAYPQFVRTRRSCGGVFEPVEISPGNKKRILYAFRNGSFAAEFARLNNGEPVGPEAVNLTHGQRKWAMIGIGALGMFFTLGAVMLMLSDSPGEPLSGKRMVVWLIENVGWCPVSFFVSVIFLFLAAMAFRDVCEKAVEDCLRAPSGSR